jgi:hypothetical protein
MMPASDRQGQREWSIGGSPLPRHRPIGVGAILASGTSVASPWVTPTAVYGVVFLLGIFGDDPGNIKRLFGDLVTDGIVSEFSCDADRGRCA